MRTSIISARFSKLDFGGSVDSGDSETVGETCYHYYGTNRTPRSVQLGGAVGRSTSTKGMAMR